MNKFTWFLKVKKIQNFIKKNKNYIVSNFSEIIIANDLKFFTKWISKEIVNATNMIDFVEQNCKLECKCIKGCSGCCSQAIYINPAEYEILKYYIKSLDKKAKKHLNNKANHICNSVNESLVPFEILNIKETNSFDINVEYSKLNLPCLFLEDNTCSIYNIRPISCWTYRQYNDKKNCDILNNLKYDYNYSGIGNYVASKMYKCGIKLVNHNRYYLLPYAIRKIIKWDYFI